MRVRPSCFALVLALPLLAACERVDIAAVEAEADDGFETILASSVLQSADVAEDGRNAGGIPLFEKLAAEIPAFGGLFRNGRCHVGLVLTDLEHQDRAVKIVIDALTPIMGRACSDGIRVFVVKGEFTYHQLMRYLKAARPLNTLRGVLGVGVDFSRNRLVVTIVSREVVPSVLEALARLDIPQDAVTFQLGTNTTVTRSR